MSVTMPAGKRTSAQVPVVRRTECTVILKLGRSPKDWCLVDRRLFLTFGATFPVSLRPAWRPPKQVVYAELSHDIYELGLVAKDGSFHLERGEEFEAVEFDSAGHHVASRMLMDYQEKMTLFDASMFIESRQVPIASANSLKIPCCFAV